VAPPAPADAGGVGPGLAEALAAIGPTLEEARRLGLLGPGPADVHIRHAWRLVPALPHAGVAVDLGSGAGVPGLVLAVAVPGLAWVLIEAQERRGRWLVEAARRLGVDGRVTVLRERAEETARGTRRGTADVVTARSFGPPAVTAEVGAPLLRPKAELWVSEPPRPVPDRWPPAHLEELGLAPLPAAIDGWAGFRLDGACPERYPRRVGIPTKRPLW
jgi:16S rRNA (guanine527-N7)-methyltransferase